MATLKNKQGNLSVWNKQGKQVDGSYSQDLEGLNPKELIESSIGMCLLIVIQRMLDRDNIQVKEDIMVEVHAKKAEESPSRFDCFEVNIILPDQLSEPYKHKLIKSAEKACTISNTVKEGAEVIVTCT